MASPSVHRPSHVIQHGLRLAAHVRKPAPGAGDVAAPSGGLHLLEQLREATGADGRRRGLERMRGALNRVGLTAAGRFRQRLEALRQRGGKRRQDAVHGLFRPGLAHRAAERGEVDRRWRCGDRKSTRLNSSHDQNSYAVFCLKKKKKKTGKLSAVRTTYRNASPPPGSRPPGRVE